MSEQEVSGGKFLPVFFVDEVKLETKFQAGEWPLHLTLFPPVKARYQPSLGKAIRTEVNLVAPFYAAVGGDDVFGEPEAIDNGMGIFVRKLEENESLRKVHNGLVKVLSHLEHDPQFRRPYTPHVSIDQADSRLNQGSQLWVEGMSIVAREPGSRLWQIVDKMRFKGEVK